MGESNWIITTILGTIIGLLIPIILKVLYFFSTRYSKDVILGNWTEYTMCSNDSGIVELRKNELKIRRGILSKYIISIKDQELDLYKGNRIVQENHSIIFNLVRTPKHGEVENITLRYKWPIDYRDGALIYGLWLSYDFANRVAIGPTIITKSSNDIVLEEILKHIKEHYDMDSKKCFVNIS